MFLHILFLQNMWIFLPLFPLFSMHLFYAILVDRNVWEKPFFLNRCLRIAPQEGSYLMKNIRLHHPFSNNMTAVSNYFIDYYMPQAGGEYVKLYLCLLRHAADYGSIPLESIAELFDYTERDIYRGLQYWADQGLIDLAFDQDRQHQRSGLSGSSKAGERAAGCCFCLFRSAPCICKGTRFQKCSKKSGFRTE